MSRGNTGLFNDIDRKSAGLAAYSKGGRVTKNYQQMQDRAISVGTGKLYIIRILCIIYERMSVNNNS
jgi:hypothetical protein